MNSDAGSIEQETAPTALARRLVAAGRKGDAEAVVGRMIRENFDLPVKTVSITADWSSLNSLNGLVETDEGRRFFFKFHRRRARRRPSRNITAPSCSSAPACRSTCRS
jgi:hypothetical protein